MNAAAYCATSPFILSLYAVTHKAGEASMDEFLQHQTHPSPDCNSHWSPVLHEFPLALLTSIKYNKPLSFCPGTQNLPTVLSVLLWWWAESNLQFLPFFPSPRVNAEVPTSKKPLFAAIMIANANKQEKLKCSQWEKRERIWADNNRTTVYCFYGFKTIYLTLILTVICHFVKLLRWETQNEAN